MEGSQEKVRRKQGQSKHERSVASRNLTCIGRLQALAQGAQEWGFSAPIEEFHNGHEADLPMPHLGDGAFPNGRARPYLQPKAQPVYM